jgi:hypothetical protein
MVRSLYTNSQFSEEQFFEMSSKEILLPSQSPRTRIKTTTTAPPATGVDAIKLFLPTAEIS